MSRKGYSARLIFGAGLLALCWFFPKEPVFWFAYSAIAMLLITADGVVIEPIGRGKGLTVLTVLVFLLALAGYGISLLPPFAVRDGVNALSMSAGPLVALVVICFECAPPAPARKRVRGGRPR
jgi:hypothetical protein